MCACTYLLIVHYLPLALWQLAPFIPLFPSSLKCPITQTCNIQALFYIFMNEIKYFIHISIYIIKGSILNLFIPLTQLLYSISPNGRIFPSAFPSFVALPSANFAMDGKLEKCGSKISFYVNCVL
jgi:hypothetical protein